MIFSVCSYGVLLAWMLGIGTAFGESKPRLISSSLEGVIVALDGSDFGVDRMVLDGRSFDRVSMGDWLPEVGAPAVPVRGALLGV
ncbi:MAG: hypothetical protein O7G87_12635, partial [bacterium]|nr:hypothetical protein [bacterium]